MKITFVGIGSEQLAISLLSGVLKREGHETSLAFNPALFDYDGFMDIGPLARALDRTDALIDEIVAQKPDLLAFSVLTAAYKWSLRVAEGVKAKMDVAVIFGGVHPSAVPEVCLENVCVDYVCVGEGEEAMVKLCEVLPNPGSRPKEPIPNLRWRDGDKIIEGPAAGFIQDLDSLPRFDKDLWAGHVRIQDNWMTMSSRGCPYRCTFCFNNFFANIPEKGSGKYLRQRSIDSMMGELIDAKQKYNMRRVDFEDDIFTVHKSWIRDFTKEYKREIDRPFQCLVHPRFMDDDIARWLKDAGCQHVQMGVQSVDEEYKRKQLLRMEKDSHLRNSLAALAKADLDLKLDHILGLPGEPLSAQELARELYAEYPPRRIQTFWLVHLPGVELTTSAVERGELSQEDYDALNRGEVRRYHAGSVDWLGDEAPDSDLYRRYELLFRLMTVVPKSVARRMRVEHIPNMPAVLNHTLGMSVEVVNSVKNRDSETWNYVRFYARQVPRQAWLKLKDRKANGWKSGPKVDTTMSFRMHGTPIPTSRPPAQEPSVASTGTTAVRVNIAPRR